MIANFSEQMLTKLAIIWIICIISFKMNCNFLFEWLASKGLCSYWLQALCFHWGSLFGAAWWWSPENAPYLVSQLSTIAVTECWCLTPVFHVSHVSQGRSSTRTRLGASWCINASTKQLFLLWHSSRPWELSKRCCTKPRVHARSGTARDQNE